MYRREAGVLAAVEVREGQLVAAGDLLARMDDTQAQLASKRAQIELDTARVEAANDVDVRFAQKSTEVTRGTEAGQRIDGEVQEERVSHGA